MTKALSLSHFPNIAPYIYMLLFCLHTRCIDRTRINIYTLGGNKICGACKPLSVKEERSVTSYTLPLNIAMCDFLFLTFLLFLSEIVLKICQIKAQFLQKNKTFSQIRYILN
jgi:hypothetical protein